MQPFKNILYVTEESVDQVSAVARAVSLAENNQAKLTVIDVISPVADDYRSETVKYHTQKLETLIKPHINRIEIQIDVLEGISFLEIIRAVIRNSYDLVIKAAENSDFLKKLFGNNDMHLLRKCPCPVWLIKSPEKSNYNCILAAVDFDPLLLVDSVQALNNEILDRAAMLALSDSASLHIVHAWEAFAEKQMLSHGDITKEDIATHVQNQQISHQKGLHRIFEEFRDRVGADIYNRLFPIFHLPKGSAKRMIALLAADLQADIVVMGTIARTGISGLIIGNTAESIINQLTCSVLAIKPPGFKTPVKIDS